MTESELRIRWQAMSAPPLMSLDYVRHRMRTLEARVKRRNALEYWLGGVGYLVLIWCAVEVNGWMFRAGIALTLVGATYSLWRWIRIAHGAQRDDFAAVGDGLASYRRELERQHAARHDNWRWYIAPSIPGTLWLIYASFTLYPERWSLLAIASLFAAAWIGFVMWCNSRAAASLQREIDALDSLRS